jgi:hypothetical protein
MATRPLFAAPPAPGQSEAQHVTEQRLPADRVERPSSHGSMQGKAVERGAQRLVVRKAARLQRPQTSQPTEDPPAAFDLTRRLLTQKDFVPLRIVFRHPAPADTAPHRKLLGRAPEFGATFDGFEAELAWLAEPSERRTCAFANTSKKAVHTVQRRARRSPPRIRRTLSFPAQFELGGDRVSGENGSALVKSS